MKPIICPECSVNIEHDRGDREPNSGDVAVCPECDTVSVFRSDEKWHTDVTKFEWAAITNNERYQAYVLHRALCHPASGVEPDRGV